MPSSNHLLTRVVTPGARQYGLRISLLFVWLLGTRGTAEELPSAVRNVLAQRCLTCHDAETKQGGFELERLLTNVDSQQDAASWVKVEAMITKQKMPPPEEDPLSAEHRTLFSDWFEQQYVLPGGQQRAGPYHPRRLTREELQNTLEDILQIDLRQDVTNSRLHVIPDTVVEKFFAPGVVGASGFSNDAVTLSRESVDIQTYARCFALVLDRIEAEARARQHLYGKDKLPENLAKEEAQEILTRFAEAAFRRPLSNDEKESIFAVYCERATRVAPAKAMQSAFLAVLLSPPFLYRFEEPVSQSAQVSGVELASRLSYFLWSAPPDAELLKLAAQGTLRESPVLQRQVQRMLRDPKRIALAENLGGEWFEYKQLRQQSSVNKRSDKMAGFYRTQYEEALLFFDSVLRFDQSIFSFVDADWAFINRHQAGIYRLETGEKQFENAEPLPPINMHYRDDRRSIVEGNYEYKHLPLTLVGLKDADRGGFLTLGPTLSVTSTENRTSPIRRGVWVLERVLGEHFEVPEDVPDLESTQKRVQQQKLKLSHNEILKLHSSQPGCSSCHQYIDPVGFGLEVFDQLGIRRALSEPNPGGEQLTWTPQQTPSDFADETWQLAQPLVPGTHVDIFFRYEKGRHRLDIRNVRLQAGELELDDRHTGFAGEKHRNNVWHFSLPKDAPTKGWRLVAEIRGNGGTDSQGRITISGPLQGKSAHQLPNGQTFSSPAELKTLLLSDYREQIIENAIHRVLAYALGRQVMPTDRPAIRRIRESWQAANYRLNALVEAVVLSYPFRYKDSQ